MPPGRSWFWGQHPFGSLESVQEIMMRVMANRPEPWPTPGPLGELVMSGLAQDPTRRPGAVTLAQAFAALA